MSRKLSHAFDDLRANPVRNFLATFSVFIGVIAVVAIVTISSVITEIQIAKTEQKSGRNATFKVDVALNGALDNQSLVDYLEQSTTTFSAFPSIAKAELPAKFTQRTTPPFYDPFADATLTAIAGDLTSIYRLPLISGQWFDSTIDQPIQLVVNRAGQELYGSTGSALTVRLTDSGVAHTAVVTGVVADGISNPQLYGSLLPINNVIRSENGRVASPLTFYVHASEADFSTVGQVMERSATTLGGAADMTTMQRADDREHTLTELKAQQNGFMFAGAIALVVSSIGILNIGLASVKERARELVVRRAVGARRSDLVGQVLLHAVILALIATAFATAITIVAITYWVPSYIPYDSPVTSPSIPWGGFVAGLVAALTTTLVGSLIPAISASHLTIADALRA